MGRLRKKPIRQRATLFQNRNVVFPLRKAMNNIHADFRGLASETSLETFGNLDSSQLTGSSSHYQIQNQNPRKKRSKLIRVDPSPAAAVASSSGILKPKPGKRADPSAPKITRPCSECGKKFWSWKALFGHMRCHPERQWRGINPPPNFRRSKGVEEGVLVMTEDDHEVAACLLMLANGAGSIEGISHCMVEFEGDDGDGVDPIGGGCRFECSSCKKVFGSHQALGGHRASHKNVKGCFAITKNEGEGEDEDRCGGSGGGGGGHDKDVDGGEVKENLEEKMLMVLGHKCSICLRVFSSGQALGGHKRCHWERVDEPPPPPPPPPSSSSSSLPHFAARAGFGLDLNLPAPLDDDLHCSHSSSMALDLKLGL